VGYVLLALYAFNYTEMGLRPTWRQSKTKSEPKSEKNKVHTFSNNKYNHIIKKKENLLCTTAQQSWRLKKVDKIR
jgi:hypothetical protein